MSPDPTIQGGPRGILLKVLRGRTISVICVGLGVILAGVTAHVIGGMGAGSSGAIPVVVGLFGVTAALLCIGGGLVATAMAWELLVWRGVPVTARVRMTGVVCAVVALAVAALFLLTVGLPVVMAVALLALTIGGWSVALASPA